MRTIERVELHHLVLPLRESFATRAGVQTSRPATIVRVVVDGVHGWGECVAMPEPTYSPEWAAGAAIVLRDHLVPRLFAGASLGDVQAPMARAALKTALLDAELRAAGISLAAHLGATRDRVPAGVAIGFAATVAELLDTVAHHVDAGYRRVKLKIRPGWDVEPVRAVRERFGHQLLLQVDANGTYRDTDTLVLRALDEFDLLMVEQPLPAADLVGSGTIAGQIDTPVCLDESITDIAVLEAADRLGACSIVCIKPARLGGLDAARRVHDVAVRQGMQLWCGGMLETGIGRAALLAVAALPGCTLPNDLSATGRWYDNDLTPPVSLDADGMLAVPSGPGIGVEPDLTSLVAVTVAVETLHP